MISDNLPLTVAARIIFIVFFLLDNGTLVKGKNTATSVAVARRMRGRDWAWFFGKEAIFVGLGFLHETLMIIVVGYSLMLAGSHLIACARRSRFKVNLVLGWIFGGFIKHVVPFAGILISGYIIYLGTDSRVMLVLQGAIIAIAGFAARSIVAFLLKRRKARDTEMTVETILKMAKRGIAQKTPRAVKIALLACVIAAPVSMYFLVIMNTGFESWTEYIRTPDGVALATDVYRVKNAPGPQPVMLMRWPYNKGSNMVPEIAFSYLQQGYTVVVQDERGRYASNGTFIPFQDDYRDGSLTISWIKNQSWCNGDIATFGVSAGAVNQYYYADEPTGALKFQSLYSGTPEAYDMIFPGGAFRKALLEAWLTSIWISNSPFRPTEYADDLTWIFDHPVKNDSWNGSSLSMNNRYAYVNVSAIHYGGWYDLFTQATLDGFYGYNYLGGSRAQGKQRLVMGPVGHGEFGRMSRTFNGASTLRFRNANQNPLGEWEYEMRSAAMFNTTINWTTPNVAYYLMGDVADPLVDANKWIYTTGWPVPYNNKSYYLNGNKSLSLAAPGANQTISYLYDPADPVSTKGGNNFCQNATLELDALGTPDPDYLNQRNKYPEGIGPYDQARAQNFSRQDIIVFESPALMTPLTITGRVTANLWVSSNCTDTTFTAMLMDQYENGSCYNIMDGILVMRYRDGIDQVAADLQGVTYYRITIDLWSTAWQFNTGHKIKVAISSSNYPRFERHPNNSNPITNHPSLFNIANNSILCGTGLYNASITLPVVA